MLKHVTNTTTYMKKYDSIGRVDTISLNSSVASSSCSDSSITDSGYEPTTSSSPSRSSSSSSIHIIDSPKVPIKIHTRVLCTDAEYKTLSIYNHTTCREIVQMILAKFRLKHRDPKLFYLTLEAWIKQTGIPIRSVMTLEDDACPALLQSCYTQKDLKFTLLMRRGGIVKIYDTCFPQGTLYKSLLISERTTAIEAVQLLLNCCNSTESVSKFALYEICPSRNTERLLNVSEPLLAIQCDWPNPDFAMFQLRYAPEQKGHKTLVPSAQPASLMSQTNAVRLQAQQTQAQSQPQQQQQQLHEQQPRHHHHHQQQQQQQQYHHHSHHQQPQTTTISLSPIRALSVPSRPTPIALASPNSTFNSSAENFRQNFKQQLSFNLSMRPTPGMIGRGQQSNRNLSSGNLGTNIHPNQSLSFAPSSSSTSVLPSSTSSSSTTSSSSVSKNQHRTMFV